jgi:transglutaminase-like putative cysteine protease
MTFKLASRRSCLSLFVGMAFLLSALGPLSAKDAEKVLHDEWMVMKIAGDEAGWVHVKIFEFEENGAKRYRTESESSTEMKRFGQTINISTTSSSLEDERGCILEMEQKALMSGVETFAALEVRGDEAVLTVKTVGKPRETALEWSDEVLGPMGTLMLRRKMGLEPGTAYDFKSFTLDFDKIMKAHVEIEEREETELLDGETANLTRVKLTTDVLPGVVGTEWWDGKYSTIKSSTRIMGMLIDTYLASEERAKKSSGAELKSDLIMESMAQANVNLPSPQRIDSILYELKSKDPVLGLPENLDGTCQTVLERDEQTAVVRIDVKVPGTSQWRPMDNPPDELAEYLKPNAYLQSDHETLRAKAHEVVGEEREAWRAACLLERFVFEYIADKNMGTAFASAAEVLANPSGDCSEHGVLLAALCRAVGIPSRVALGYMFLGGIFGAHMWAEVWIDGAWYPLDGVIGAGRVDPTHIRFTTSSLNEGGIGLSFAEILTALGNLEIKILEFTLDGEVVKIGETFQDYRIEGDTYTNTLYGISITKPEGYRFDDYEHDFSELSFELVELDGKSDAELNAIPATFTFDMDEFKRLVEKEGAAIVSELPRKVHGRDGAVFMLEVKEKTYRLLAVMDQGTCFTLRMKIRDEERDIVAFEAMVDSIRFDS